MKFIILLIIGHFTGSDLKSTSSQYRRIKVLQEKLIDEIRPKNKYIETFNSYEPITRLEDNILPIRNKDMKKYKAKLEMKTTPYSTLTFATDNVTLRARPKDIFYRKMIHSDLLDLPSRFAYCQDIFSPYLLGIKRNVTAPVLATVNDSTIIRFINLLNMNTSTYTREEIYSVLYQISTLNLKLYKWDIEPMYEFMDTLLERRLHSFANLRSFLKARFKSWHLDVSNATAILEQTRIIRPPCVQISVLDGSTKVVKQKRYTKPEKPTTVCDDEDASCNQYY